MKELLLLLPAVLLVVPHSSFAIDYSHCTKLKPNEVIILSKSNTCYAQGSHDGSAAADKLIDKCKKSAVIPPHNNFVKELTGKYKAEYIEGWNDGWGDQNSASLMENGTYGFSRVCHE